MLLQKQMSLLLSLFISVTAFGKSFELKDLKQAKNPTFVLNKFANRMSYYTFIRTIVGPKMQQEASSSGRRMSNEAALYAGQGVSVKLSESNYNVHINFPNAAVGGRSYGWTRGKVGDWSDAMYLDSLEEDLSRSSDKNTGDFYRILVAMLGASNASQIDTLDLSSQLVATNFLAIYTAEAYRAMVPDPHMNWDDALLQVTLLGAFHSGQRTLTKYYVGQFSDQSRKQDSGVYNRGAPGPKFSEARKKKAQLRDYWQFSANPDSKQSGINITRNDFEKMGAAITAYEKFVVKNPKLDEIFAIVGGDKRNVIKAIADFFTEGKSRNTDVIEKLANDVADLMMDIKAHAEDITRRELDKQ